MTSPRLAALLCALACALASPADAATGHAADGHPASKHRKPRPTHHRAKNGGHASHPAAPAPSAPDSALDKAPTPATSASPAADPAAKLNVRGSDAEGPDDEAEEAGGGAHFTPMPPSLPAPPAEPAHLDTAPAPPLAPPPPPAQKSASPAVRDPNGTGFALWHPVAPTPGTAKTAFAQAAVVGGGTIVGTKNSSSLYQAGVTLRAAYVVHPRVFVATDLEVGGGSGTARGVDRLNFNAGVAAGVVWPLHPRLYALPSLGVGYNLWMVPGAAAPGRRAARHALQLDLRAGVATPITERISMVVTPYLQPNLVHGGTPADGLHIALGLSAGVVCWL